MIVFILFLLVKSSRNQSPHTLLFATLDSQQTLLFYSFLI